MVLPHRDRIGRRRDLLDPLAGIIPAEREHSFHFRIHGKIFCERQINGAACGIQSICALLGTLQSGRNVMGVAQKKIGGVD